MSDNKPLNILIVEDSLDDVELLKLELKNHNFQFNSDLVQSEEKFREELGRGVWDLIICDYSMPSFDAMKALKIKQDQQNDIPFILVSGTVGEELAVDAMINGADDYVMKDNLRRLTVAIEREIKNLKVRREKWWADKKYRLLFENSPDGVVLTDEDGRISEANKSACSMIGVTPGNITEYNFFEMLKQAEDDMDVFLPEKLQSRKSYRSELELGKPDGSTIPIALSGQMFENLHGRKAGSFIFSDISKRLEIENQLIDSLKEKNILLSEIHHRVKNNMAIISSLLFMQAEMVESKELKQYFTESMNRIKTMATVHEMLYRSESMDCVDFQSYIEDLTHKIQQSMDSDTQDIEIKVDCNHIKLGITKAIPCGLIVNELLTNSFQHAFIDNTKGEISIKMKENGENFTLQFMDNGQGIDEDALKERRGSMGLLIIDALVKQLDARMNLNSREGTRVDLEIPIADS